MVGTLALILTFSPRDKEWRQRPLVLRPRALRIQRREFPKRRERFSLSPRERGGVRGNGA